PMLYLLKEPVPTLIIVVWALALALFWMAKKTIAVRGRIMRPVLDYIGGSFMEFSMASFIILYWGYSMHSPLNIGVRHIIPTLPFFYILSAVVWKTWVGTRISLIRRIGPILLLFILLIWLGFETIFAAPYFLSYFNEFGGGLWNGFHYVTDSNYD